MIIYSGFTRRSPHLPPKTFPASRLRPHYAPRPRPQPPPPLPPTRLLPSFFFALSGSYATIFQSRFLLNNVSAPTAPPSLAFPSLPQSSLARPSPFYRLPAGKNYVIEFFYNSFSMGSLPVSSPPRSSPTIRNPPLRHFAP